MVNLTIDTKQLAKLHRTLHGIENGVPKALAPAINRALAKGRTTVKREIRKEYLIKAKDIPVAIRRASTTHLTGSVVLKGGMLPLNRFKVKPAKPFDLKSWYGKQTGVRITPHPEPKRHQVRRKRQVFAQVKRKGGAIMPGAFVPAGINYIGPFIRASGAARLPIHKLMTIGAPIMASQPAVAPEVMKQMGETLAKRIDHEMGRVLARSHK